MARWVSFNFSIVEYNRLKSENWSDAKIAKMLRVAPSTIFTWKKKVGII